MTLIPSFPPLRPLVHLLKGDGQPGDNIDNKQRERKNETIHLSLFIVMGRQYFISPWMAGGQRRRRPNRPKEWLYLFVRFPPLVIVAVVDDVDQEIRERERTTR